MGSHDGDVVGRNRRPRCALPSLSTGIARCTHVYRPTKEENRISTWTFLSTILQNSFVTSNQGERVQNEVESAWIGSLITSNGHISDPQTPPTGQKGETCGVGSPTVGGGCWRGWGGGGDSEDLLSDDSGPSWIIMPLVPAKVFPKNPISGDHSAQLAHIQL